MNDNIISDELINKIREFLDMLDMYGFELNDDGDIVEKNTNKLILDKDKKEYYE